MTSLIILTFILAITQGRVTFFNDFTFSLSPNLKPFVPSSLGISFFESSGKVSRKQSSHFFLHTVVLAPESKIAEFMSVQEGMNYQASLD